MLLAPRALAAMSSLPTFAPLVIGLKKKLDCRDVLSFAKAHVRVRHLEATGGPCSNELQVMRFTSPCEWSTIFDNKYGDESRRTYAPTPWIPGAKPGELLFRTTPRRICGKTIPEDPFEVRHYNTNPSSGRSAAQVLEFGMGAKDQSNAASTEAKAGDERWPQCR